MRALVFGRTGQVATELARFDGVTCLGRDAADLTDPAACAARVDEAQADVIINAAAYTAVDNAEADEQTAHLINADAVGAIAKAAAQKGLPFLHISTDYVFDGSGAAPWAPAGTPGPMGAYGRTKLAGEQAVAAAGGTFAILRTSWVFSAHGSNFVKTMLRLAETREQLTVVNDQIGGPTAAKDIAAALIQMARGLLDNPAKSGIYHFSGAPDCSWADFAAEIFSQAQKPVEVIGIPTKDYPTPAARPANSRLDCSSLAAEFGINRPDWQASLAEVLQELGDV